MNQTQMKIQREEATRSELESFQQELHEQASLHLTARLHYLQFDDGEEGDYCLQHAKEKLELENSTEGSSGGQVKEEIESDGYDRFQCCKSCGIELEVFLSPEGVAAELEAIESSPRAHDAREAYRLTQIIRAVRVMATPGTLVQRILKFRRTLN